MKQMTIKQLADKIGVSKTAIRKHLTDDFRENYTETAGNGVLTISSEGCKLIAETMQRTNKLLETSENHFTETTENIANITIPLVVWNTLQAQLEEKDRQLASKDEQIRNLTETAKVQAQSINTDRQNELAGTMKQLVVSEGKKHWFHNPFKKNKE